MPPPVLVPEWAQQLLANHRAYGSLMEAYRRLKREKATVINAYLKAQRENAEKDARIAELEQVIIRKLPGK